MEKWCLLDPSGFEYLKMGERVGKDKGREISDWLFASVTLTRILAQKAQDLFRNCVTLPSGMLRGHSKSRKGSTE